MPLASRVRRCLAATAAALALTTPLSLAPAAGAATPPDVFGTDWDDPRTADQPIERPDTPSCTVRIVDHGFRDFTDYTHDYVPPADCAGDWSKVVLTLHGAVAGRQYDRLGWLSIDGVPILKTSTPEPSPDGIEWTVEKDLTAYSALLRHPGQVVMRLGNVVNETYTGVLDIDVDLTFYGTSAAWPAADTAPTTAETVQPLDGAATTDGATSGTLTVPANTERLTAQVYASGSGGGCEEFWYTAAPTSSPDDYSCKTAGGPWRELQVSVDGRLAGIATPYPHIYTGGWSNPFLWYVLPAPRAFDLIPVDVDLTPFVGTLTDGRPHQVSVRVVGAEGSGWSTPVAFLSWQDAGSQRVTGAVTAIDQTDPVVDNTTGTDGDLFTADLAGRHALTVTGYVNTSHGKVVTTVQRSVGETVHHRWSDGEYDDQETLAFTDAGFVRTKTGAGPARFDRWDDAYGLDGAIHVTDSGDITTTMSLSDRGATRTVTGSERGPWRKWDDRYAGSATWNYLVPRAQRRSTGWSEQDFTTRSDVDTWHRRIHTVNGIVTEDTVG